jgi:Ser/Thr protein kinase RdoA (MazF antagonist)
MTALSIDDTLRTLVPSQRASFYTELAHSALRAYDLGAVTPVFLQHNSGITYCIMVHGSPRYLLKIHEPAGEGDKPTPALLQARMAWLAALSDAADLTVQTPLENRRQSLLTTFIPTPYHEPAYCTLQRWIDGTHVDGDFTVAQIAAVGSMMARLHIHSTQWQPAASEQLPAAEAADLASHITSLRGAVQLDLLSAAQFATIERASGHIQALAARLGQTYTMWGAVHGDLHHANILFSGTQAQPIDFDALHVSYYLRDLGITLYHILYQDPLVRQALFAGYCAIRPLPAEHRSYLEAFVTWAAIENLAFQITLPDQRPSPLFARNLCQLADIFCAKLIAGTAFVFV